MPHSFLTTLPDSSHCKKTKIKSFSQKPVGVKSRALVSFFVAATLTKAVTEINMVPYPAGYIYFGSLMKAGGSCE